MAASKQASTKHTDVWTAFAAAQAEFKAPAKSGKNPHFHSEYSTLGDIFAATMSSLHCHGLCFTQIMQIDDSGPILISRIVMHDNPNDWIQSITPLVIDPNPQKFGSLLSYMKRYAAAAMFAVVDGMDDDGEAASSEERGTTSQRTTQTCKTQQRPQNQSAEATGQNASVEALTDEDSSKFITWARNQDREGGPCTEDQYKYLVDVINGITGQTTHKDVLKLLLGRDVSSENVPSYALTTKLLDWLTSSTGSEKQNTWRANENYNPQYAACIRKLHETVMENSGQHKLIEEAE